MMRFSATFVAVSLVRTHPQSTLSNKRMRDSGNNCQSIGSQSVGGSRMVSLVENKCIYSYQGFF